MPGMEPQQFNVKFLFWLTTVAAILVAAWHSVVVKPTERDVLLAWSWSWAVAFSTAPVASFIVWLTNEWRDN